MKDLGNLDLLDIFLLTVTNFVMKRLNFTNTWYNISACAKRFCRFIRK